MGQNHSSKGAAHSNYAPKPKHLSSTTPPPFTHIPPTKHYPKSTQKPKAHHSHHPTSRHEEREHEWDRRYEYGHRYGHGYNYEGSHRYGYERERGGGSSSARYPYGVHPSSVIESGYVERGAPLQPFSLSRATPSVSNIPPKMAQIEKYFNKYKDEGEDAILAEGMEKFCIDLGVDPTEFVVLLLAWKFEASQMCRFTREEFLNGCQKLRAHDAKSLKDRLPELQVEVRGEKIFKDLYNFTFTFGLDHSTGQRSLPLDMAIPLWGLVFSQDKPVILDRWFAFLKATEVRGISRDTWNMFLPFCNTIRPDLSNYDESEAWPSLFDDFVEYETEQS